MVAHGDAEVLGHLLHVLDELLPPLLGERRNRDPDELAVVLRVEAEVRGLDGLLDRHHRALVEGLDDDERRLRHRERGDLAQWRPRAVVVDHDAVEQLGGGAAGAHVPELLLEGGAGGVHLLLQPVEDRVRHARPPCTSVPIDSFETARRMLPGRMRSKTRIGMLLSMQSDIAVASMTWSWRFKTSR